VYGAQTVNVKGVPDVEEHWSHGYCGNDCANATEIEIMDFADDGLAILERAHMVGENMYYKMLWVDSFIRINRDPVMCEMRVWDEEVGFYDVFTTFNTGANDLKETLAHGKAWAQAEEMILALE
jgi:hypothetical protein